jgi:hypothetical protein
MMGSKLINNCLAIRGEIKISLEMMPQNSFEETLRIKEDRNLDFEQSYEINNIMNLKMYLSGLEIFICD